MANDVSLAAGIEAFQQHHLERAQAKFAQAVVANPNSEDAWLWLARVIADPQHRLDCYQRVLEINPRNPEAAQAFQYIPASARPISVQEALAIATPRPSRRTTPPLVVMSRRPASTAPRLTQPKPRGAVSGYVLLNLLIILAFLSMYIVVEWFNVTTQVQNIALTPARIITRILVPTATLNPAQTPTRPPTPRAQTNASRASDALFAQMQTELDNKHPQKVLDGLPPNLPKLTDPADLSQAYFYLGRAELDLEDYPAAAGYFKKLYALDASVENLFMLAVSNDLAGNQAVALENYTMLAAWNGKEAALYHGLAERRIADLKQALAAQSPTVAK